MLEWTSLRLVQESTRELKVHWDGIALSQHQNAMFAEQHYEYYVMTAHIATQTCAANTLTRFVGPAGTLAIYDIVDKDSREGLCSSSHAQSFFPCHSCPSSELQLASL